MVGSLKHLVGEMVALSTRLSSAAKGLITASSDQEHVTVDGCSSSRVHTGGDARRGAGEGASEKQAACERASLLASRCSE
ncbi:MAG: hypothetical protein JNJ54_27500 [Myxococcaceae bacterium]|nr:hypothetical protein [Myxococcaceae bacterium]